MYKSILFDTDHFLIAKSIIIASGQSGTSFVKFIADQKGISRRQSQRFVSKEYELFIEDLGEMNIAWKEIIN